MRQKREGGEERCLTRGDARSRTLDGIDERQCREVREPSSREKEKKKSVSFLILLVPLILLLLLQTIFNIDIYIYWLCKRQFHLGFTYFLLIFYNFEWKFTSKSFDLWTSGFYLFLTYSIVCILSQKKDQMPEKLVEEMLWKSKRS